MRHWNIFFHSSAEQHYKNCCTALLLFCFLLLFSGCAKKVPSPLPEGVTVPEKSFQEYLAELDSLERIKFLFTIKINKQDEEISGNASMTVNREEVLLRVYSFGFLISEIKLSQGHIFTEGKKIPDEKAYLLIEALRSCLLWWDMEEREIEDKDNRYIVRNSWRKVYVYRNYLPEKQEIYLPEVPSAVIIYDKPLLYLIEEAHNRGLWFPSEIKVRLQGNEIRLNIEKITIQN